MVITQFFPYLGLFKAREILKERFGHIYVSFGEPISVRKYFMDKIRQPRVECQVKCRIYLYVFFLVAKMIYWHLN